MATQKEKVTEQSKVTVNVPKYTAKELAFCGRFGYLPECVVAAMQYAGRSEATFEEAKKIVDSFMKREVR